MSAKEIIAARVAKEFKQGDVVNLGIGLPTLVANYIDPDLGVTLHSENGFLGLAALTEPTHNLVNAGGQPCGMTNNAAMFDSMFSFSLIRGGHIDICVLGGLQVDEQGNLANWMVPGKIIPGMGGAMDLVVGAKKMIIAMEHCAKNGESKILRTCQFPLTAQHCVDMIVTEWAVFHFIQQQMILSEINAEMTIDELKKITEASFIVAHDLKMMREA